MNGKKIVAKARRGFTLIELLVVILILAILASLIVPQVMGQQDKAKVGAAKSDIATLSSALDRYKLDVGSYPTQEQGLEALDTAPSDASGWHGPYLTKPVPNDPWGHPYNYINNGEDSVTVMSYGADGVEGGTDYNADISG